jgi:hypothetical protein
MNSISLIKLIRDIVKSADLNTDNGKYSRIISVRNTAASRPVGVELDGRIQVDSSRR